MRRSIRIARGVCLALGIGLGLGLVACDSRTGAPIDPGPEAGWPHYGGDRGGMRYSPATQISKNNVGDLEVAWTYHSGDVSDGSDGKSRTSFNATPLLIDHALVYCTPMNRVIAVDAETGEERWAFDPVQRQTKLPDPHSRVCRGRWSLQVRYGLARLSSKCNPLVVCRKKPRCPVDGPSGW